MKVPDSVLRILLRDEEYLEKSGDLEEAYLDMVEEVGPFRAKAWFWLEVLKAVPGFVANSILWRFVMFKNNLKIALRNIRKQKGYSLINIVGLAVGLAVFLLISLYVQYELSFDKYHENSGRIFRILHEEFNRVSVSKINSVFIPGDIGPALVEEFPEVIRAARFFRYHIGERYFIMGDQGIYEKLYYVDPEFFQIFSIPFVKGDPKTALNDPFSLVLSERLSKKYFGNEDPVGKHLTIGGGSAQFKITGVFKTMPDNSHLVMDLMIPLSHYLGNNQSSECPTYILLRDGADSKKLEQKLHGWLSKKFPSANNDQFGGRYFLQALTDIHLRSHIGDNTIYSNYNDIGYVYIYSSVALLILMIVGLNYMNLTAARSFKRSKEIGVRNVIGASRTQLFKQFLGESILMTFLSFIGAMILVVLFLPGYQNIVGSLLSFTQMLNPTFLFGVVLAAIFIGILGGSYPAFYLSSFRSIKIWKRTLAKNRKRSRASRILVTAQFSMAIMSIISLLFISSQLHFIKTKDIGYERKQIVVLSHLAGLGEFSRNREAIKKELLQNPKIISVSGSVDLPNHIIPRDRIDLKNRNGEPIPFNVYSVDHDFVDLYGLQIVEGRDFRNESNSGSEIDVLINQTAARIFGGDSPLGQEFRFWGRFSGRIVGIVKDFHSLSLHHEIPPTFIAHDPFPGGTDYLSIKINNANVPETIDDIKRIMNKFAPHYQFDYHFFDEIFEKDYRNERKMEKIFGFLMLLSFGLACIGLVGMALYSAELRIKEIGIRKVLGATVRGIAGLLSKDFVQCILFANIFSWPIAYYFMRKWLQKFAYRIDLGVTTFILSGSLALVIALLTISYQTIKAATANPVDSLRHE